MLNTNLYTDNLKRLDLLNAPIGGTKLRVAVYRNHSFEMVASVINAFLHESGYIADFVYSDYDDSLNFDFHDANIQLIWLDTNRYKSNDLVGFLSERVNVLRSQTTAPILVAYTGDAALNLDNLTTDCFALRITDVIGIFGDAAYDVAKESFSGTRLSNKSCLEIARVLGMRYFPAMVAPALKAVVVDLDNTLYSGVLGEDGVDKIIPNNEFQQQLKGLKDNGFFLCIASKNEEVDVINMFQKRTDFILRWDDFTVARVNWKPKDENIIEIAKTLNIGTDAILFIDDNPAEIENVATTNVHTILATDNICSVMKYYPGLLKLKHSSEDKLRADDIRANIERAKLAQSLTPAEYFAKLGICLEYHVNDLSQMTRVAELFGKTNQFILTYARYNETVVNEFMTTPGRAIVTIRMSDNLSDSGVIAILATHKSGAYLVLDEMTVSCRALGRKLENVMLPYLFAVAAKQLGTDNVIEINYKHGERNGPAMQWLAELAGTELDASGCVAYEIPENIDLTGLKIEVM